MARTSNRELARQLGVSETAVRRAERAGRIKRESDGSWDAARVKAAWSDNTDQAQQRPPRQRSDGPRRATLKPVPEAALGAVRDTLREHGEPVAAEAPGSTPGQVMTFMQARTANEVLKAQERRLRLQRMKGELVDRAKAVAQVFRLARDERDAWVNWPARVAAMIAAELEVDPHQAHIVLERHVRDHLAELAEVRPSLR
jgi:DNA-binding Lrp family transcriptional regulator